MCMSFLLNFPLCVLSYLKRVCNIFKIHTCLCSSYFSYIHKSFQPKLMQNSSFWCSMLMDCHSFFFITRPTIFWPWSNYYLAIAESFHANSSVIQKNICDSIAQCILTLFQPQKQSKSFYFIYTSSLVKQIFERSLSRKKEANFIS